MRTGSGGARSLRSEVDQAAVAGVALTATLALVVAEDPYRSYVTSAVGVTLLVTLGAFVCLTFRLSRPRALAFAATGVLSASLVVGPFLHDFGAHVPDDIAAMFVQEGGAEDPPAWTLPALGLWSGLSVMVGWALWVASDKECVATDKKRRVLDFVWDAQTEPELGQDDNRQADGADVEPGPDRAPGRVDAAGSPLQEVFPASREPLEAQRQVGHADPAVTQAEQRRGRDDDQPARTT